MSVRPPRSGRLLAAALGALLLVSGCSPASQPASSPSPAGSSSAPSGPGSGSPTSTDPSASGQLAAAKVAAAQYDYGRALKILQPLTGADADATRQDVRAAQKKAVRWKHDDQISHLFFHSLVVDPDRAFDGDDEAQGYEDYMATVPEFRRTLQELLERARRLGTSRVFCLTFEVEFFAAHGFAVMANQETIPPEVFAELLRSHDEGVAEFLDLARVKPNTLGNTRMIRSLTAGG